MFNKAAGKHRYERFSDNFLELLEKVISRVIANYSF